MEARVLRPQEGRAYAALRLLQAQEDLSRLAPDMQAESVALAAAGPDRVIERYVAGGAVLWGAFDGASLVGAIATVRQSSLRVRTYLWVWGLYVRAPYRGTPASRVLADAAFDWCERQPRGERVFGAFDVLNLRARRFCDRHHFQRPDEDADALGIPKPPGFLLVERMRTK